MNKEMKHWKNARLITCISVFLGLVVVMGVLLHEKTPEETAEAASEQSQRPPESADTNVVRADTPRNTVPEEPLEQTAEKPVPIPESVVPESIRRPRQGEALRYPHDAIIGALGAGDASFESYRFAQRTLRNLLQDGTREEMVSNLPPEEIEQIAGIMQELNPREVRIGGGRNEADGSISFLLRFIGTDTWSGGEIYIRRENDTWNLESLILDNTREMSESGSPYRFDFPPYERFF